MSAAISATIASDAGISPASPAAVAFPLGTSTRPADTRLFALRMARTAFGIVLAVGALNLPVAVGFKVYSAQDVLLASWGAAAAVFALVFGGAFAFAHRRGFGRLDDRWLRASLAWPLAGLALILPLTIHALVMAGEGTTSFDKWVGMSCAIVGHCHIGLALMAAWRVHRLVSGDKALPAPAIYGITVGLAMVPGAIFLLIPPFIVAATGLPFLFLLWIPEHIIKAERRVLARG